MQTVFRDAPPKPLEVASSRSPRREGRILGEGGTAGPIVNQCSVRPDVRGNVGRCHTLATDTLQCIFLGQPGYAAREPWGEV